MKKPLVLFILCLTLGLALAACGDDDSDGDSESPAPSPRKAKVVDMKDIKYVPAEITIKASETIQWTNSDSVTHTVTKQSGPGQDFDSGNIAQEKTYERAFTSKGTINYFCKIHPNQRGVIRVQ